MKGELMKTKGGNKNMADDKFKLPLSSYDELVKFIKAYSTVTKLADISEISSLTSSASSPVGATSAHSLASFLRQSLLSYLVAALLFVNPAPSVFVGDVARAARKRRGKAAPAASFRWWRCFLLFLMGFLFFLWCARVL